MKKVIKKYWGIGLVIMLLSSLFVAGAPVSAADPLNWETKTDAPSALFHVLEPGSEVIDYDVAPGGMVMYAITRAYACTAAAATAWTDGGDGLAESFTFTYVNENGVAARTGTVSIPAGAAAAAAGTVTLQIGDSGVTDITNVAATAVVADATAGTFNLVGNAATVLATFTFALAITDGAVNPQADVLYQSTFGGGMWTAITARLPVADFAGGLDYVAIAPDDPNTVVVATDTPTAAGLGAAISVDGGSIWSSMGNITSGTGVPATAIYDLTISPMVTGAFRYVAISGTAGAGLPGLYYYNYGSGVGAWRNACVVGAATDFVAGPVLGTGVAAAYTNVRTFQFSKNFPSDFMGSAVLEEDNGAIAADVVDMHILSFNSRNWDTPVAAGYPIALAAGAAAGGLVVNKASIAMYPDYDGGDEATRILFVGAKITDGAAEAGGVWRCYDNAAAAKVFGATTAVGVSSVAWDGTNLAAGASDTNVVYRSADPLVTSPTFLPSRSLKRIGVDAVGNDMVNLMFVGEVLYGAKLGVASCIAKSVDYGNTWNDFTLMDSALTTIDDIYFTQTGDPWYISGHDNNVSAVYRVSMFAYTRVLVVDLAAAGNPDFMLRGLPSEPGVVYAADEGGTTLYYSADGGTERWYRRGSVPVGMADLAVESAQVIYIGDAASVSVYKSVNAGFVWGLPINTTMTGFNAVINMIICIGENNVIVAGNGGGVAYTADGGSTWTNTMGVMNAFGTLQIAASGLAAGDYLFASEEANNTVWRCELGPGNPFGEWKSMNFPATAGLSAVTVAAASNEVNTGLQYYNGVLYVLQTDVAGTAACTPAIPAGTSYLTRSAAATVPGTHLELFWGTRYAEAGAPFLGLATTLTFNVSPTALKCYDGASGGVTLAAVDTASWTGMGVKYFDDTIIMGGPTLIAPADGKRIEVIAPMIAGIANVNFTWNRMSKATGYFLFIALDEAFTEMVLAPIPVASVLDPVSNIVAGGTFLPGTTYYWRVSVSTPISSGFSETRSFIVQTTAASVPTVSSPENGGTIASTTPAFSWTPAAGALMYQFQLSDDPSFATTLMDEELANAGIVSSVALEKGKTYFWRVKVIDPVDGDWSTVANFMVAAEEAAPAPPVVIEQTPAPIINIPEAPPATVVEIPPAPPVEKISPAYIWAIIIIGAVLVIAVIVLIVRTRRQV
ncbi:MAG: hypothetical protein JXA51_05475 [Dehalococcoidales bacterium]|nr:hypothetical protein [Dehalococcoidales bacterium]